MVTAIALALSPAAYAAPCDAMLAKAGSLAPAAVAPAFVELAKCDRKLAEGNFTTYLKQATDSEALVALFGAAIGAEVWGPVLTSIGNISSYEARDEIAQAVGESCTTQATVVPFLQFSYQRLKSTDFRQWDDAFGACESEGLWTWVEGQIKAPPEKAFDEKFEALVDIYVKHAKDAALPVLGAGAVKAAAAGPYDMLVRKMGDASRDQAKLGAAMVDVARQVPADKAKGVASTLAVNGAEDAAASLLPVVFPGLAVGGAYTYGGVSVEAGVCGGKKTAYVHAATVTEPGKRWTIQDDLETPFRAFKPKLGKDCSDVVSPWPVIASPEPVSGSVDAFVDSVVKKYEGDGYSVKVQKEKAVALP